MLLSYTNGNQATCHQGNLTLHSEKNKPTNECIRLLTTLIFIPFLHWQALIVAALFRKDYTQKAKETKGKNTMRLKFSEATKINGVLLLWWVYFIIGHKLGAFSSTLKDSTNEALYNVGYCIRTLPICSGRNTQTFLLFMARRECFCI